MAPRTSRTPCSIVVGSCLLAILALSTTTHASSAERGIALEINGYQILDMSRIDYRTSISSATSQFGKARADSFYLYGGPGSQQGRFETIGGAPDEQGWTTVDLTEVYPHWRASTTNAATLGGGAPGNHAVICHNDPSFGIEPYNGYGNNWDDWLVLRLDLGALGYDPTQDLVELRWIFDYVHDTEPDYDFFVAEWSRAGAYQVLLAADGSSYNDSTGVYEPVPFDSGVVSLSPADYYNGEIWLRLHVESDVTWSDEDNLGGFTTDGRGAAAVDDIRVYLNDTLVSYAGWEPLGTKADLPPGDITGHDNGAGPGTEGWLPTPGSFVGDFARLFANFQDIDPCRENRSWQWGFIDDGTPPSNDPQQRSTGGSVSATWSYGIPGGWVVNYTGGLTGGAGTINNRIVSPEIEFDLPGTEDDGAWGCIMGGEVWAHLPFVNCMFYTFEVRAWTAADGWGPYVSPGWVYYSNQPAYLSRNFDVTRLLPPNPAKVQLRVGVIQYPFFSLCDPTDATPAPVFDNLYIQKYVLQGPMMFFTDGFVNLGPVVYDSFPTDGTLDGPIRWDWNPGRRDSVVIEMITVNLDTQLADPIHGGTMEVALLANPEFGDHVTGARSAALQSVGATVAGQGPNDWPIYTFSVQGEQSTWDDGSIAENLYFFDLPDGPAHPDAPHQVDEDPLFFRGDVIHYYIQSTDDAGGISTLPTDVAGFLEFDPMGPFWQAYVVQGLPNLNAGQQPPILFWDFRRWHAKGNRHALRQAGLKEGVDFDYYRGDWIAGPRGLSREQINGYEMVFANDMPIDSIEVDLVLDWRSEEATRQVVWMGRNRAQDLQNEDTGQGLNFLNNILGVDYLSPSVRDIVDGQYSPSVGPVMSSCFATTFSANANCPSLEDFNHIGPTASGAEISHQFLDASGNPYVSPVAAGIFWRQETMGFDKSTAFYPFSLSDAWDLRDGNATSDPYSERSWLIRETLQCMGMNPDNAPTVDTGPPPLRFAMAQNIPNPFNPSTRISYSVAYKEHVRLMIYDVSGRKVRTLLDEPKLPGHHLIDWDSSDDNGSRVASGIYHYRIQAGSFEETKRMVLIK